jgi:hypothetical protein
VLPGLMFVSVYIEKVKTMVARKFQRCSDFSACFAIALAIMLGFAGTRPVQADSPDGGGNPPLTDCNWSDPPPNCECAVPIVPDPCAGLFGITCISTNC